MVADGEFLQNTGQHGVSPNQIFVLNALDAMSQNADLIRLRSREVQFSPLDINRFIKSSDTRGVDARTPEGASRMLEESKKLRQRENDFKLVVKWINYVLPSVLLLLMGLFQFLGQRKRRKKIGEIYG